MDLLSNIKMDLKSLSAHLLSHLSPTPLHAIIYQYTLPMSLASCGISFSNMHYSAITLRYYFSIESIKEKDGDRHKPLSMNIKMRIHRYIENNLRMDYEVKRRIIISYGDIFIIECVLNDPSHSAIYNSYRHIRSSCTICEGRRLGVRKTCSSCYGTGLGIELDEDSNSDLKSICDVLRLEKEKQIVDKHIHGSITSGGVIYNFHLLCIYSAFYVGSLEERTKDYSSWESEARFKKYLAPREHEILSWVMTKHSQ